MRRHLDKLRLRLRSLFRSSAADRDLARELRAHLDEEIASHLAAGVPPDEARRRAAAAFGSLAAVEDHCRDTRRVSVIDTLGRDVRYGCRSLAHHRGLLLAATTSIALGVGANLTIFTVGNSLLLASPTAAAPDTLVRIRTGNGSHVSYAAWRALDDTAALAGVAGYDFEQTINLRTGSDSVALVPLLVTANFFDVLQPPMALGRGFTAEEARAERDPHLVVVSYAFWQRRLGADPARVGRDVMINGEAYTVTGVLPADFRSIAGFGLAPEIHLPLSARLVPGLDNPRQGAAQLFGRLRPDQSLPEARQATAAALQRIGDAAGDAELARLREFAPSAGLAQVSEFEAAAAFMLVLFVVSGLVLAIACANVAGLLLARAQARRREMALRLALGASRGRLVQQLMVESLLLTVAGSVAGAGVAAAGFASLSRVTLPLPLPVELHFALDARTVGVAITLVLFSTLVTGLLPALQSTRASVVPALKQADPSIGVRRLRLRSLLVVAQVAVSAVLLVAALLFVRSLQVAGRVDLGFDAGRVLAAQVAFVEGRQGAAGRPVIADLLERVRTLPGVEQAAFSEGVPLTLFSGSYTGTEVRLDGRDGDVRVDFASNRVSPGYLDTMGIRLLAGRDFTSGDRPGAPPVILVNDAFARHYLPGLNPIGRRMVFPHDDRSPAEIVGVVSTGKYRSLSEDAEPAIYEPMLMDASPGRHVQVLIRAHGDPGALATAVRATLLAGDPSLAVSTAPLQEAIAFALVPSRLGSAILGLLGLLGTVLAMVGLGGVVAFEVGRRTRELAIRLSLGATRGRVLRLVLGDAGRLAGAGLVIGGLLAALVTGPLSAFLVAGVRPLDPLTFAGAGVLLGGSALVAVWSPARRAMRIAPGQTLKAE